LATVDGGVATVQRVGSAIVQGVFAVGLALLSWFLTNASRRDRLIGRIQKQSAILKELPPDHPARADLDAALATDATALRQLSVPFPWRRQFRTDFHSAVTRAAATALVLVIGLGAAILGWKASSALLGN
jgi:hypothetical protein